MHSDRTVKPLKNKENAPSKAKARGNANALTNSDDHNGYVDVTEFGRDAAESGVKTPLSLSPTQSNDGYLPTVSPKAKSGYVMSGNAHLSTGYLTVKAPTGYIVANHTSEQQAATKVSHEEEIKAARILEEAVKQHDAALNAILLANGFINGVNIKSGVTAHIAIFEYIGKDPDMLALTRNGYVMVKLPPYIPAEKTIHHLHAELTYNNEFAMLKKLGIIPCDTRPKLLAKEIDGRAFIFNSPVFHDEERFLELRHAILTRNGRTSSSGSEDHSDTPYEFDVKAALEGLLQQAFHNLSSFMRKLAVAHTDPREIFDVIFNSMLHVMNKLHKDGFVHRDWANRNCAVLKDGTVKGLDYGTSTTFSQETGLSTTNERFPISSMMNDAAALRSEDSVSGVITDYVSLQKTMLQVIADYCKVDFYLQMIKGLPNAPKVPDVEFIRQFSDRQLIDQAKNNLIKLAKQLVEKNNPNGQYVLDIIEKYEPYFNHDHNLQHNYQELRAANMASFLRCTTPVAVAAHASPRRRASQEAIAAGLMNNSLLSPRQHELRALAPSSSAADMKLT